ncbi:MAG: hypothetical protein KBT27_14255 [Prevotellaceae bacterium]|nr:hypothetical protein [Candidatus Faecinaster equi]
MKRFIVTSVLAQLVAILSYSQSVKLDTIYYDKYWKGVSSAAFASFYRIYDANDKSELKKHFRDYYITGELQSEGGYISIDKYDDSKSVFDGEWTNYFKSGKVEHKGYRNRGIEEGEYTAYYENGLVKMHAVMKNGKANGILTQFNEEGNMCSQIEMLNGEPRYDYYILSNKDGYSSKLRISDNTPIYESPSLNEKKVDYRDGAAWPYYTKNGIMVAMTNTQIKDYGKWFQISLIIANNSIAPIEFDPELITSSLQKTNGQTVALEVWSSDRYMRKVRRTQNWNMALAGIGEGLAAASAGYSTSTTHTNSTYNGYSNLYGNAYAYGSGGYAYGSYNGYGSYHGNSSTTSRTTTYDGAAAYQAQVIASNRIANYENSLLNERAIKQEGYLRKTTVYPGDAISGYVNIKRISGSTMTVIVDINGAKYEFPWNISK